MRSMILGTALLATATAAACVEVDPDESELATTEQAIMSGDPANAFQWVRAAHLPGCTGTVVHPRFVLTALHCIDTLEADEDEIELYSGWERSDDDSAILIKGFRQPPGTDFDPSNGWGNTSGVWADIALVELDAPTSATVATMSWSYPGPDRTVIKVGAGMHENEGNSIGTLLQRTDMTTSANDVNGKIYTSSVNINHGDSGGPLYHNGRVLGVLHGGLHTSVPRHLNWILFEIGYRWSGSTPIAFARFGTLLARIDDNTERVCQYACEKHSACVAYNYFASADRCELLASVGGYVPVTGWRSATK